MNILATLKRPTRPRPADEPPAEPEAADDAWREPDDGTELPPLTMLREGLPPYTALIILLAMFGGAGYVTYLLAIQGTADNNVGAMWADFGIFVAGFLILWFLGTFAWLGERMPIGPLGRLPEPGGLRDDSSVGYESLENYRRRAGVRVHQLIERLVYDYGLMLAGHQPELDYASPQVRTLLAQTASAVLRGSVQIKPDFGNHVEVSIDWNTHDALRPITATAYFIDQSTKIADSGMAVQMPRRKMRIVAAFNHQLSNIIDAIIGPA